MLYAQEGTWELLGQYDLDGNATDTGPYQNHGEVHGARADFNRFGIAGKCMFFDGIDDYIEIGHIPEYQFFYGFKISMWFKQYSTNFPEGR